MKYMGSKHSMLSNGLGETIIRQLPEVSRFIDLFCGSGAVAIFAAQHGATVQAYDLQNYSTVLANAVINRTRRLNSNRIWENWVQSLERCDDKATPTFSEINRETVAEARFWSGRQINMPITQAYGGYYFSPSQAVLIDLLRSRLPRREPDTTVALAALLRAASKCVASPGHTAQPFQATDGALPFIRASWNTDLLCQVHRQLSLICGSCVPVRGIAEVGDANEVAMSLEEGDLVFLDPPYSGVHYSRFYHVLETISHGKCGEVSGSGRYPPIQERPRSKYSLLSESNSALKDLLRRIASRKCRAIMTFPAHNCSNGLSGSLVLDIAREYFHVQQESVITRFSTLGGTGGSSGRSARISAKELILTLMPK